MIVKQSTTSYESNRPCKKCSSTLRYRRTQGCVMCAQRAKVAEQKSSEDTARKDVDSFAFTQRMSTLYREVWDD